MRQTWIKTGLLALLAGTYVQAQVLHGTWTDCPAEGDTTELVQRRGVYTQYGMKLNPDFRKNDNLMPEPLGPYPNSPLLRFGSETYPRVPATFVQPPQVQRDGTSWTVSFALSGPDDVRVRVLDAQGKQLRLVASGVVGLEHAAEPFAANSLKQSIRYDGLDASGQPVPSNARVQVSLGLDPKFDQFIGYDPSQLTAYVSGLQVDAQGRLYVSLATQNRVDPIMLRFTRDGVYDEMLYPSSPENLKEKGLSLAEIYQRVETFEGREVPVLESLWRTHFHRFEGFMKIPFIVSKHTGKGYFVEGQELYTHPPKYPETLAHIFPVDLDPFFFKPYHSSGEFGSSFTIPGQFKDLAIDKEGNIYMLMSRLEKIHNAVQLQDKNQWGAITKLSPETQKGVASFTHHGTKALGKSSPYLGRGGTFQQVFKTKEQQADEYEVLHYGYFEEGKTYDGVAWEGDDDTTLLEPEELAVDEQGNILVIDGIPRRIKMYAADGKWLGEVSGLNLQGSFQAFFDLISIESGSDADYVLTTFRNSPDHAYLLKVKNLTSGSPEVIWMTRLDRLARFIAVDESQSPARVWVANGAGRASLSMVEDLGTQAAAPKHLGGFREGILSDPWQVRALEDGTVYVYDYDRHQIVRTNADGSNWKTVQADIPSKGVEYNAKYRRWGYGYDTQLRSSETMVKGMFVDPEGEKLWVSYEKGYWGEPGKTYLANADKSKGYEHFDLDLNLLDIKLPDTHSTNYANRWVTNDAFGWTDSRNGIVLEVPWAAARSTWFNKPNDQRIFVKTRARELATGKPLNKPQLELGVGAGTAVFDSRGNIYTVDLVDMSPASRNDILFGFPNHHAYWSGYNGTPENYHFWRGDRPVTHQNDVIEVVKFGPDGGRRGTDAEKWAHRGAGFINNFCGGCTHHATMLASNPSDHIIAGDPIHHMVKILDPAGNLVQTLGCYGNAEIYPQRGGSAKDLGFHNIYNVDAVGDDLYVTDRDLKRLAKVKLVYRQQMVLPLP